MRIQNDTNVKMIRKATELKTETTKKDNTQKMK